MDRELSSSSRGKPQLFINGNKYFLHYTTKKGGKIWQCLKKKCKSKIITFGENDEVDLSKSVLSHVHATQRPERRPTPFDSESNEETRSARSLEGTSRKPKFASVDFNPAEVAKNTSMNKKDDSDTNMEYYDDIMRAREIIKKKHNELRRGEKEDSDRLEKYFKPVADPLKAILRMKEDIGGSAKWHSIKEEQNPELTKKKEEEVEGEDEEEEDDDDEEDEGDDENLREDQYESANESEINDSEEGQDETSHTDDDDEDEEAEETVEVDSSGGDNAEPDEDATESLSEDALLKSYIGTHFGPLCSAYFREMITDGDGFDHSHGVRLSEGGRWMVGDKVVRFDKNDNMTIGEKTIKATPGLLELIFKRSPEEYTGKDLDQYKQILEHTNAHRQLYRADKPLRATTSVKYKRIIRPLYMRPHKKGKKIAGEGVLEAFFRSLEPKPQKTTNVNRKREAKMIDEEENFALLETKYVDLNDPNEWVQRLDLLLASRDLGHSGLEEEISFFESKLRQGGYIL